jgi:hypothetical protein
MTALIKTATAADVRAQTTAITAAKLKMQLQTQQHQLLLFQQQQQQQQLLKCPFPSLQEKSKNLISKSFDDFVEDSSQHSQGPISQNLLSLTFGRTYK